MDSQFLSRAGAMPDVYTDLQGLQKLRNQKNSDEALRQVAEQFESMFLSLLLKNMRQANAVFEEDSPFSSSETKFVRDMYDQQLSLNMAHSKGTGLAEVLYRQLSGQYGEQLRAPDQVMKPQEQLDQATPAKGDAPESPISDGQNTTQRAALADSPADFMEKLMPHARQAGRALGLDPLLLVAQAALETGWGKHVLADGNGRSSNNLFNIKASTGWTGESLPVQALEYRDGLPVQEQSRFKQYSTLADSFADFVALIQRSPRYAEAMDHGGSADDFAASLQKAGYATDPNYADKVIKIYRDLTQPTSEKAQSEAERS